MNASKVPVLTLANALTILRMMLTPVICWLIAKGNVHYATVVFVVASVTDYLDGYVARLTKTNTPLGSFLDPLADKILVLSCLVTLVLLEKIQDIDILAVGIIVLREVVISILRPMSTRPLPVIPMAKWKTALQMTCVFLYLLDIGAGVYVLWIATLFSVFSLYVYLRQAVTSS